jgi:hypothetical protein
MRANAWTSLLHCDSAPGPENWLGSLLEGNAEAAYLKHYGSPRTMQAFRTNVPTVTYDELTPWLSRIERGESDVLFTGRPVAFERTSGNVGGAKLIPYSAGGLGDFRHSILPWLRDLIQRYGITGSAYFSISAATRPPEFIGSIPVGLSDGAYLGIAAAKVLASVTAVPMNVAGITDVENWREQTLRHLRAARDLELISIWSPTFLLRLLEDLPDPHEIWPRLKLVSCWTSGASARFAAQVRSRFPHTSVQPKGLLSTECVVTVPDTFDRPVLTRYGFFEFERQRQLYLAEELEENLVYEVVATTASGLYRYRTGDLVRCMGETDSGLPLLEFVGRGDLVCDLVGEKLNEPFVEQCLSAIDGFRLLVPGVDADGYVLLVEAGTPVNVEQVEKRLGENPQYAYARQLGQLKPLRLCEVERLFERYSSMQLQRGVRIGDVKPLALRKEASWSPMLRMQS